MAETTATTETPEDLPVDDWRDEAKQNVVNLWLAHRGLDIERVAQVRPVNNALMKFAASGDKKALAEDLAKLSAGEDGDMGVSIGNKSYHYYSNAQAAQTNSGATAPVATPQATPQAQSSVPSTLAKAAVTAAMLAAGGVGGAGVTMAVNALTNNEAPAVVQPAIDTDTNAGLRFEGN